MTLVVGILCEDCVVIGTDSAMTFGHGGVQHTIAQPLREKISIFKEKVIVAGTGEVGLGQRFNRIVEKKTGGSKDLTSMTAIEAGEFLSREAIENFQKTFVSPGNYGALVAIPCRNTPTLIEFSLASFQPEIKDKDCWYVSMGSGQMVADPLLGFMRRVFWGDAPPNRQDGVFATAMVLALGCEMAPTGVAKPIQIAVLGKDNRSHWRVERLSRDKLDGHLANVESAIEYFKGYREVLFDRDTTAPEEPAIPQVVSNGAR